MAEHDGRRLFGRQLGQSLGEVPPLDLILRIRGQLRAPDTSNHLANLAKAHLPLVRDRAVDGNAVNPGFSGSDGLPGAPFPVGALESIVCAVFSSGPIAEHRGQGAEDLAVRRLVQAFEVSLVAWLVFLPA